MIQEEELEEHEEFSPHSKETEEEHQPNENQPYNQTPEQNPTNPTTTTPRPTEQELKKRKQVRKRQVQEQQANEFLKQPVVKIVNLNKNLKRAYEKGFLDDTKYDFIKTLRKKRKHPEQDSVSSHYQSDQSWDIREALPKKGFFRRKDDILSSSNSEDEKPKIKRITKPRQPRQPRQPRKPREPKEPKEPREPREPKEPREPRPPKQKLQTKKNKQPKQPREPRWQKPKEPKAKSPIKKQESQEQDKQPRQIPRARKTEPQIVETKKPGVTIKITKAPPGTSWKNGKIDSKNKNSESGDSLESESSFKSSSGDEEELPLQPKKEPQTEEQKQTKQIIAPKEIKTVEKNERDEVKVIKAPPPSIPVPPPIVQQNNLKLLITNPPALNPIKPPAVPTKSQPLKNTVKQKSSQSNSSSSDISSSQSSSSSDSSSDSSDESKSKQKQKHKHSKNKKDDSSSESSSERSKKKKRHKKHKKRNHEKPSQSLITKVIKQHLNIANINNKTINEVKETKIDQQPTKTIAVEPQPSSKQEGKIEKIEQVVQHNIQNKEKQLMKEQLTNKIEVIKAEQPKQNKSNAPQESQKIKESGGTEINKPQVHLQLEQKSFILALQNQNPKNVLTISKDIQKKPHKLSLQSISISIKQAKQNQIKQETKLKPILKEGNHVKPNQRENFLPAKAEPDQPKKILRLQPTTDIIVNQPQPQQNKSNKSLTLDNKVVVLQLMVGSSEKNNNKNQQNKANYHPQDSKNNNKNIAADNSRLKNHKIESIIEEESDDSQEPVYYSRPRKPRHIPENVVRVRKIIVERSDSEETDSSNEYVTRRIVRTVRKPVVYESSSESSAVDYGAVSYRRRPSKPVAYSWKNQR